MPEPKYPDVRVALAGEDGNAMSILGRVGKAIRRKYGADAAAAYREEATAGDYDDLLRVTMETVNCDAGEEEGA